MAITPFTVDDNVIDVRMNQMVDEVSLAIGQNTSDLNAHKADYANLKGNLDTAKVDQVLSSNGDGTSTFKTIEVGGTLKALEVLTIEPTGEDLYEGRIWIKKFIEVVEVDTLSQVDVRTGATTIGNPQIYKTSPNYRPTTNIKLKKIILKMTTSALSTEHTTSNPIRCRICNDDGNGLPNEASVLATTAIPSVPVTLDTTFYPEFMFDVAVPLLAGTLYHFVFDVPSGTGKTFVSAYLKYGEPTNDGLSANVANPTWTPLHEDWTPSYKIIRIE